MLLATLIATSPWWSNPASWLAIFVFLVALGGALKVLPELWAGLKGFGRFLMGFEKVSSVPTIIENQQEMVDRADRQSERLDELVLRQDSRFDDVSSMITDVISSVADLADSLRLHMEEEERLRQDEKTMVSQMVDSVDKLADTMSQQIVDVADVVFKQAVFADPVAYYIIKKRPSGWEWAWGNSAYFKLTGLTEGMARGGQYWYIVKDDERDRVYKAATKAGDEGRPLEVDFTCVNMQTKIETPVTVLAWPIHNNDGDAVGYLGAIHVRH